MAQPLGERGSGMHVEEALVDVLLTDCCTTTNGLVQR